MNIDRDISHFIAADNRAEVPLLTHPKTPKVSVCHSVLDICGREPQLSTLHIYLIHTVLRYHILSVLKWLLGAC